MFNVNELKRGELNKIIKEATEKASSETSKALVRVVIWREHPEHKDNFKSIDNISIFDMNRSSVGAVKAFIKNQGSLISIDPHFD